MAFNRNNHYHESSQEKSNKKKESNSNSFIGPKEDESNWLVSYADMMTLLCGFFIMLFSMSKIDEPKYDSFKEIISKQFGGKYVSPHKELVKEMSGIIEDLGINHATIVKSTPLGIMIAFESLVFFGTLSAEITTEGNKILSQVIESVSKRQRETGKKYHIVVEGHTDDRPILSGIYPSNWELSSARALRVVKMFLSQGFEEKQLTAIGSELFPQQELGRIR